MIQETFQADSYSGERYMTDSKTQNTYVALLRGINVGGKNKLPMKDLAGMFTQAGCSDVRTYIQSGNVIFRAPDSVARKIPGGISQRIEESAGYRIPVVLRTAEELRNAVAANPFIAADAPEKTLHVYFLANAPDSKKIESLDPGRSLPDTFHVSGREIYLQLPNGMARTKLTNVYFDSKLATVSTARNWNTVLQLLERMQA